MGIDLGHTHTSRPQTGPGVGKTSLIKTKALPLGQTIT